jgi:hypothetical protein
LPEPIALPYSDAQPAVIHFGRPRHPMTKNTPRKSFVETIPSYLAGLAAVATATIAVLTFIHNRQVAPGEAQETAPATEPEVDRQHVGAVPSMEIAVTKRPKSAPPERSAPDKPLATVEPRETQSSPQPAPTPSAVAKPSAPQATPTLAAALRPSPCAAYVGAWRLSSGELVKFFDNERLELTAAGAAVPRFGRWNCSGRNGELLYMTIERERTIVFTASGDGTSLYQRADRNTVSPLAATRESAQ